MPDPNEAAARLARALDNAERAFVPHASRVMGLVLNALEGIIEPYPPQPSRTRGKGFNTYVRGIGYLPRSAFKADAAQPGGFAVKRKSKKIKAKIRYTSQKMDTKFRTKITPKEKSVEGKLENLATYSGYVLGNRQGDPPHQMPWHTQTGWMSKDEALKQLQPYLDTQIKEATDRFLKTLAGK